MKKNYKFPVGGVVSLASALIVFVMSTFCTWRDLNSLIEMGAEGISVHWRLYLGIILPYIAYISLSLALLILGVLVLFKVRNACLVVSPAIGISTYFGLSLLTFLIVRDQFNVDRLTYCVRNIVISLERAIENENYIRSFIGAIIHNVSYFNINCVVQMISYMIISLAFVVFAVAILVCVIGKKKEKKGILAIVSAVMATWGFGSLASITLSWLTLNALYHVVSNYPPNSTKALIIAYLESTSLVLPLTCLVCVAASMVLAGLWVAKPYKKAKAVEPPVAE